MNTITAPAANWTGKTMAIEMSEDRRSFTVDLLKGYWFHMEQTPTDGDGEIYSVLWGDAHAQPRNLLCRVSGMDFGDGEVEWFSEAMGVSREGRGEGIENAIIVAAQMAMNLI